MQRSREKNEGDRRAFAGKEHEAAPDGVGGHMRAPGLVEGRPWVPHDKTVTVLGIQDLQISGWASFYLDGFKGFVLFWMVFVGNP